MSTLSLVSIEEPVKCEAKRGRKSRTTCELPPDHIVGRDATPHYEVKHFGRDSAGRWQSWSPLAPARPVPRVPLTLPRCDPGFLETEKARDDKVRQVPCPVCGAQPRRRCSGEWTMTVSHTGRYLVAVDADLVPPLAGSWTG